MSGKGKRRSARLLKLEEQKNDDGTTVCLLDPWQIIRNIISGARGKRKRNEEIQGEAACSQAVDATNTNNLSVKSSTGQIIEYIIDTLEMRDTHELFAMPDDIQVSDYAERVNSPGDFATLRQKNRDGMYNTLEQFENDVYMVFQKAMSINNQDTIPYREAMSLLDQAKQVFLSLKTNQMYSESDLVAWRQKYLDRPKRTAGKEEGNNGGSHDSATPTPQRPNVPAKKKGTPEKKQENAKAANVSADNSRAWQRGAKESKSTPVKRARKAATAVAGTVEFGGAGVEQRRLTYTDEADQGGRTMTMPVSQDPHATLLYQPQPQGHTYQESLRRFVRHAGMKARVAAEFKILECDARARQNPVPAHWNDLAPSAGAGTSSFLPHSSYYPPPPSPPSATATPAFQAPPPSGGRAVGEQAPPWRKLETDELLKLFVLMGKPVFLEAKQMFGYTRGKESSREGHATRADDDAMVGAAAAAPGEKSCASEPAFGPFAPPSLSPGRLGFGQFAGSSAQPFKLEAFDVESFGEEESA